VSDKRAVWKYALPITAEPIPVHMPRPSELLTVQVQHNNPVLWALVDPEATVEEVRFFFWIGTGHAHKWSDKAKYVGTVQEAAGYLVWHLFELVNANG
jgi:hypothetical protein